MDKLRNLKDCMKWHQRYMALAAMVSSWSKHPEFQVGAVAIGGFGQVLATGYNGWPRSIYGEDSDLGPRSTGRSMSVHAEANVIYNACLTGISLRGSALYVYPMFPCIECAKALVQVGIGQICYQDIPIAENAALKWQESWDMAHTLFREANISVIQL